MTLVVPILFIILGILIKYGKMHLLIAGYNTMPAEKREKYDIEAIANVFRNGMFGMAIIMLIGYFLAIELDNPAIQTIAYSGAIILGISYLLIASNLKKYKK